MNEALRGKTTELVENAETYHKAFYVAEALRGPSLYFHQQSLATRNAPDFARHVEYVYATLVSWGMHRMGPGGSKMQPFDIFLNSAQALRERIAVCQGFAPQAMREDHWTTLREVFCGLKAMASGTSIVGNSKVMHHMMPNIVPPIDREYTFRFLRGNTNISNGIDREWAIMREMINGFFVPVVTNLAFRAKAEEWTADAGRFPWDTSLMKVVDNLIIGARKNPVGVGSTESE